MFFIKFAIQATPCDVLRVLRSGKGTENKLLGGVLVGSLIDLIMFFRYGKGAC